MDGRAAGPDPRKADAHAEARYVVFHCADPMADEQRRIRRAYYESLDLVEACIRRPFSPTT